MRYPYAAFAAAVTLITFGLRAAAPAATLTGAPSYGATTKAGAAIRRAYAETFTRAMVVEPEIGTFLGDYTHDDSWSDPSTAGIAKGKELIDTLDRQLDAVDMTDATLQDKDDLMLAKAFVANQRRGIADAIAGKDPGAAPLTVVGAVSTMIVQKPGQDDHVWWNNMISRLEKAPAFLAAARPAVVNPGKLQGIVASEELGQAAGLFYGVLNPMAAKLSADQKVRYEKARDETVTAMTDWKNWIDANDKSWPENFSMGADAYNNMLKNELLLPYTAADIERIGFDTLNRAIAEESWIETQAKAKGVKLDASQ